ncbi:MAG: malate synthase A [Gemmatimonadales bacterium]
MTPVARPHAPDRVEIVGPVVPRGDEVLTPAALRFTSELVRTYRARLVELLAARAVRRNRWARGENLDFPVETRGIRERDWRVAPLPADLLKRTVEITGPVDRKMIINALNSGADVFMADFEDSTAPTWGNLLGGQVHLRDAVRRTIDYTDPATAKRYALKSEIATLLVRPRGLHLPERHVRIDGIAAPGSLVDFALYVHHNARELLDRGTGPYFYIPKLESHLEARWWNEVFGYAEDSLGLPRGAIKATVLIETLPAAFEMDEILWELRDHSAGLNCGRWDYIFSFIKTRAHDPTAVLPDRSQVTMEQPCMRAYTQLVVRTCHRRGVHAMGGMAAQIPIRDDPAASEQALAKVRADKLREVRDGHDGTWVAHPGLVAVAREVFEAHSDGPNQLDRLREDVVVTADDLLATPSGTRTPSGLEHNIRVGVQYLEAWLQGLGCVPLYHLMEDAATAEICRTQVWQWLTHGAALDDGRAVTADFVRELTGRELARIELEIGPDRFRTGRFPEATDLFLRLATATRCEEFLTLPAYELLDG